MRISAKAGLHDIGNDCASRECGQRATPRMWDAGVWLNGGSTTSGGLYNGTLSHTMVSEEGRSGLIVGMEKWIGGSIDKGASKGSEVPVGTDVGTAAGNTDISGHCHRADGVARRRAVEGRRMGDTAGS
jgi:hypothetical protein